jgi:hypothetical protein
MTLSAPSARTISTFLVLQTPVTSAPNDFAICTANVPTPPDAPIIKDLLLWLHLSRVTEALQGCQRGQRYRACLLERQVGWFQLQQRFRNTCVLGEATRLDIGEDVIT